VKVKKSTLINGALIAVMAAGTLAATSAAAASYVVCNRWNECWRVKDRYTFYPSDARIVWHDDAWWDEHQKDTNWRWMKDPDNDQGWYDKDGAWHPYADTPPPHP
jgi:hypothetical protein